MVEQIEMSRPSQEEISSEIKVLKAAAEKYEDQMDRSYYDIANDPHAPLGEQVFTTGDEKEHLFHGVVKWGMGARQSESDQTIIMTQDAPAVVRWGGTLQHERPVPGQDGMVSDKQIQNPVNERVMTKGDVLDIPKGTPYQISPKEASATVAYLAQRIPTQS